MPEIMTYTVTAIAPITTATVEEIDPKDVNQDYDSQPLELQPEVRNRGDLGDQGGEHTQVRTPDLLTKKSDCETRRGSMAYPPRSRGA